MGPEPFAVGQEDRGLKVVSVHHARWQMAHRAVDAAPECSVTRLPHLSFLKAKCDVGESGELAPSPCPDICPIDLCRLREG